MKEIRIHGLRRVLRVAWSDLALRREVDEEIRFHIDQRMDELVRLGASREDARQRAEAEYGDVHVSARELIEVDRRRAGHEQREEVIMSFLEDLRYALRGFIRQPSLLVTTLVALGIGIAANATMFGVVDQLLVRPPAGVVEPGSLRRVYVNYPAEEGREKARVGPVTTYPVLGALMKHVPSMEVVAFGSPDKYTLGSGVNARKIDVQLVSGTFFRVLGVRPAQGRGFAPGEDTIPEGAHVAVISDGFWKRALGEEPPLGMLLTLNGVQHSIIGVAPHGFSGVDRQNVDVWVPISSMANRDFGAEWHSQPNAWWVQGFARLRDGQQPEVALAQATAAYQTEMRGWRYSRDTLSSIVFGPIVGTRTPNGITAEGRVSLWLMGVSAIVLLIACANVANLLIARTYQRRREIAVRLALGVSRTRLFRMLLTEAALLAAIASVVAIVLAFFASRLVQNVLLPGFVWSDAVFDGRVLAFAMAATVVCILLAGVAPALEGLGTRVAESLRASARTVSGGRGRLRHALLVLQAALSVVLLIGAGLFVRSLRNVVGRDVGIDMNRVLLVTSELPAEEFPRPVVEDIYRGGLERLSALPGVASVSLVRQSVPTSMGNAMAFDVEGKERFRFEGGGPYYAVVSSNFFETLGTSVLRGRAFTPDEDRAPSRSLIVNKIVADAHWPGEDPIGRCARLGSDTACSTVVGVVENVMLFALVKDDRAMLYVPAAHISFSDRPPAAILVRAAGNPTSLIPMVRREMQSQAANMPFVTVEPFTQRVASQLRPWRLGATMFTLFGIIALMIAVVGLYSVLAFWVSQRTHEIGVRMALGAQREDVIRLVALEVSRPVLIGLVLGVVAAGLASRWIVDLLYETSPRDPLVYGLSALALAIAAVVAAIVPAQRSASVDPATAIRVE